MDLKKQRKTKSINRFPLTKSALVDNGFSDDFVDGCHTGENLG